MRLRFNEKMYGHNFDQFGSFAYDEFNLSPVQATAALIWVIYSRLVHVRPTINAN